MQGQHRTVSPTPMSNPHYSSLPRSFRLHRQQPFTANPSAEPIPQRKSSLAVTSLTVPTRLQLSEDKAKAPSIASNNSDDTLVICHNGTKPSQSPVHFDDHHQHHIAALPDLPPDLGALSRDDLERLTRLLFADSCRARWVAMSEQERNKELERKLEKVSTEGIRHQRKLLEVVERQGRDLDVAKEEAARTRKRLGQVLSILSTAIPGLVPRQSN